MRGGMRDLGRPVLAAAAVVVGGAAMTILDATIVNVAIERLAVAFDAELATIQWVSTAYLIALAAAIPAAGWAVDRHGARRVFMAAVGVFAAGSLLCGLAWSAPALIAFRAVQGLGGGLVMPVGMTILARAAGPDRMGRVMALVGIPMLLAPALGPALGGALLETVSWRAIFLVNLPLAALTLVLAARVLAREHGRAVKLDVLGLALATPGLALLVAGLVTPLAGALGVVALVAFVAHALRASDPLIDLRIFRDRIVAASAATTFLFGAAFFGSLLLLALYFQTARDFSALGTGLILGVQGVGAMVTMPVAGKLADRLGAGQVVRPGVALVIVGTVPFVFVDAPAWLLACGLWLRGVGMGATLMPAMAAAYTVLTPHAVPRAASALEIVQRVGALLGIALLAVILQSQLPLSLSELDTAPANLAAHATAHTFLWALALTVAALLPALLLPSSVRPADTSNPTFGEPARAQTGA
jgi:EmrB/QacA subfamily drug resistance transporter